MQVKTADYMYMLRVDTKFVDCYLNFVTEPFYHKKQTLTLWKPLKRKISNIDVRIEFFDGWRPQLIIHQQNVPEMN